MGKIIEIGTISNTYGGLQVTTCNDKYYWIIDGWECDINDIRDWEEIPKYLYDALINFEEDIKKGAI